jgi:hypothetical protein
VRAPIDRFAPLAKKTTFQGLAVIGFKDTQAGIEQLAFGDDDDVVAIGDFVATKNLSYQSFSSVPLDGPSQFSGDRNPQTSNRQAVRQNEQCGIPAVDPRAELVNPLKFGTSTNPLIGPKISHVAFS